MKFLILFIILIFISIVSSRSIRRPPRTWNLAIDQARKKLNYCNYPYNNKIYELTKKKNKIQFACKKNKNLKNCNKIVKIEKRINKVKAKKDKECKKFQAKLEKISKCYEKHNNLINIYRNKKKNLSFFYNFSFKIKFI